MNGIILTVNRTVNLLHWRNFKCRTTVFILDHLEVLYDFGWFLGIKVYLHVNLWFLFVRWVISVTFFIKLLQTFYSLKQCCVIQEGPQMSGEKFFLQ